MAGSVVLDEHIDGSVDFDPRLFAVGDDVVADDVVADGLLVHFGEPERRGCRRFQDLVRLGRLGQPVAVEKAARV
jgi:hypothetical protein